MYDIQFKRFFCFFLSFFLLQCDHKQKKNEELLFTLVKPSLGMFGDSIMAFWPAEDQLKPFVIVKNAFPVRPSSEILEVAKNDKLHYTACLYNAGINDFLGNFSPQDFQIQNTINNQLQTIVILQNRCEHLLVLNVWYVEFPWPSEAVVRLNKAMKENILSVPRIDSERFIQKSDLLDGGHLTDIGYNKLAKLTLEHFRTKIPWIDFLPK
ncbi:SGNH/GDSL hydrolase family protein [Leptospira congkakensis]|uniref:SGNH/GDSL hydrolase family protein n=1 Tax=Leptospira congkakensis TaxID=2484932 RepID=A0A4Z1A989_9LEPT|nr:SGNH/GDSL hydrolase family protein [Leptospira congkakensis]TGL86441.1 SGNH/GDSL hydrolase family protein [Leptospira congkakensis]TGL94013.1 SGNH/GDSL hydrolase family protein [Leptospira congkakensis]TGL94581.1 SGNH/GDSL hydrolase family protein [Leptospira congkakensis]